MRRIHRDIVSALIFSKDGKLFQGQKDPAKGGVYSDCWHIPGGGMKEGETQLQALKREMNEELGFDISNYAPELIDVSTGESEKTLKDGERVMCDMTFNDYKIVIHDKTADEIVISLNDDLVKYRWTKLSELPSLKLTPPSVKLFTKLGYLG